MKLREYLSEKISNAIIYLDKDSNDEKKIVKAMKSIGYGNGTVSGGEFSKIITFKLKTVNDKEKIEKTLKGLSIDDIEFV